MMTREERAKLFAPFDAMKGLKEALAERERLHTREERRELSEEEAETVARVLGRLERGRAVDVCFYSDFHSTVKRGIVDYLDPVGRKLGVSGVTVRFDDIYSVSDRPPVRALDNKFFC